MSLCPCQTQCHAYCRICQSAFWSRVQLVFRRQSSLGKHCPKPSHACTELRLLYLPSIYLHSGDIGKERKAAWEWVLRFAWVEAMFLSKIDFKMPLRVALRPKWRMAKSGALILIFTCWLLRVGSQNALWKNQIRKYLEHAFGICLLDGIFPQGLASTAPQLARLPQQAVFTVVFWS